MTTRFSFSLGTALALFAITPLSAQLVPDLGGLLGGGGREGGAVGGAVGAVGRSVDQVAQPVGGALGGPGSVLGGPMGQVANTVAVQQDALAQGGFDRVESLVSSVEAPPASLVELRRMRLQMLVRAHRSELGVDNNGNPVRRDRLIAVEPVAASLAAAYKAGFRVVGDQRDSNLGLRLVTLSIPNRLTPQKALDRLRKAAPGIDADYDHVFEPAGGALAPTSVLLAVGAVAAAPSGTRIAMIDGGVASHPSLGRAPIEQRGFAGPAEATGHGTAVASLLVGDESFFKGAARGASLFVGDVYGGSPAAGSASVIVRALGWAASKRPRVINISLVGPANRAMERAIRVLRSRGIVVAAAVGNDGPAAPPQYPASYDGVISITGVDAKGRALLEAGKARHIDFAAPGADMVAAVPGTGYMPVRGTSFAAPLVAARFAATGSIDRLTAEARPGKGKVGRGVVCVECRVDPKAFRRR